MKSIVLVGAGGHGKVVAEIAELNGYTNISFLDNAYPDRLENGAWNICGRPEELNFYISNGFDYTISIGNNATRARMFFEMGEYKSPALIHPDAVVSRYAKIGSATVIAANAVVNPEAKIGSGVIVNTSCTIDHDCEISKFAHVSPGAHIAGGVKIGERSWIGIGASIREGVTIGCDVIVAAGACVVKNIPDGVTVAGVPAKQV